EQMGVADNLVWAISQSNDGTLYFGTQSGVSRYHNDKFQTLAEKQGLAHNQVRAVLASKEGKVYFGTGGGGVSVYENGQVRPFGLAGYFVLCIYEHLDGTIYFGTADDGAHAYKKGKWTTLSSKDGLPSDQVFAINGRWDGTIYFGTSNGVSIHKNGQFSMRNEKDGLASNFVWCIFPAKDGSVYFGTNNGLSIYKNEKWKTIDVRRGLSNNTVLGILEDEAGKIYVSTNKGINVLELSPGQARMRTLRYSDGLPSDECVLGACYKDRLGRLWFGTVKGAVRYDPQQDQPRAIPPRAYVTQLRVFNRTIAFDSLATNLIFKHDENYLTFDFVGIDLQARGKLTHRYRMAGLDQDWMEIRQRAVQYANLDDGHYTFEIQARNEWGNWSAPAKIAFTIQPPFWEKWWFVMFVTLALGGGITSLIRLRVRQLLALERLRTRIAADLHDHIGAGLTEISILSEVGAQQINRNPRNGVAGHFGKISEISRGLVERMNDIVWLVNPRRDSLDDLIRQLGSSFAEVSTCSGIIFRAQNLETLGVVRLPMEYRQQLFYIFKEALHNSLKHSAAQEVVLEAHMQGKHLHMRLKDDGKGFDATQVSYRNGLTNMHSRARMIGGSLSVCSAPGEGTVIAFDGKISEEPVEKSTWGSARKGNLKFPPNNASTLLQKLR
ncbi:MAG: sensor histidine kinase, partial [bacterium]